MNVRVINSKENYLELEVEGEEHTLGNLIVGELSRDPHVKQASYSIKHPLVDSLFIKIVTDGQETPREALLSAVKRSRSMVEKFRDEIPR